MTTFGLGMSQSWCEEDIGSGTHWTATDHLGTPFLQTDSSGAIYWQADYEPFGWIYQLRTTDAHQPLRFPGMEAEELTVGNPNGSSQRFYNAARWYRPQWGRYTQADPASFNGSPLSSITMLPIILLRLRTCPEPIHGPRKRLLQKIRLREAAARIIQLKMHTLNTLNL